MESNVLCDGEISEERSSSDHIVSMTIDEGSVSEINNYEKTKPLNLNNKIITKKVCGLLTCK